MKFKSGNTNELRWLILCIYTHNFEIETTIEIYFSLKEKSTKLAAVLVILMSNVCYLTKYAKNSPSSSRLNWANCWPVSKFVLKITVIESLKCKYADFEISSFKRPVFKKILLCTFTPCFYSVFFGKSCFLCLTLSLAWDCIHGLRREGGGGNIIHDTSECKYHVYVHVRLWESFHGFFFTLNQCRTTEWVQRCYFIDEKIGA